MSTKGDAFREAKASGRIKKHEATIMSAFEDSRDQFSREDLSTLTDIKLSSVCGAAHSLIKKGLLAVVGHGVSLAGVRVQLLGLPKLTDRQTYYAGLRKTMEETAHE